MATMAPEGEVKDQGPSHSEQFYEEERKELAGASRPFLARYTTGEVQADDSAGVDGTGSAANAPAVLAPRTVHDEERHMQIELCPPHTAGLSMWQGLLGSVPKAVSGSRAASGAHQGLWQGTGWWLRFAGTSHSRRHAPPQQAHPSNSD